MLPKRILEAQENIPKSHARLEDGTQREKELKARHEKELREFQEEKKQIIEECTKQIEPIFNRINSAAYIMYALVGKKFAFPLRNKVFSQPEMKWVIPSYSRLTNVKIEEEFTTIVRGRGEEAEEFKIPTFLLYASEWEIAQYGRKLIYKYKDQFKKERREQRIRDLRNQLKNTKKQLELEEARFNTSKQRIQKIEAQLTKGENNE